jgi:hypothetical protein
MLFSMFVFPGIERGLAKGRSLFQAVTPNVYKDDSKNGKQETWAAWPVAPQR